MIYNNLFCNNSIFYLYRRYNLLLIFVCFGYAFLTVKWALQRVLKLKIIYPKRHSYKINVLTHFKKVDNIDYDK